jgi:hypothetical protein
VIRINLGVWAGRAWWFLDPTRWFDKIPGFSDGYGDMYGRWVAKKNRENLDKLVETFPELTEEELAEAREAWYPEEG